MNVHVGFWPRVLKKSVFDGFLMSAFSRSGHFVSASACCRGSFLTLTGRHLVLKADLVKQTLLTAKPFAHHDKTPSLKAMRPQDHVKNPTSIEFFNTLGQEETFAMESNEKLATASRWLSCGSCKATAHSNVARSDGMPISRGSNQQYKYCVPSISAMTRSC